MSLKHIVHKAVKSVNKNIRRLPRSFNLRRGKASVFNPVTLPLHQLRKLARSTRGSIRSKVARALGRKSVGAIPFQYTLAGSSGSGYVHDAKSLSQLTGGR